MIESTRYLYIVENIIEDIEKSQADNIAAAAESIKRSFEDGGVLHVFSTGHSHMMVEEMFYRTGGLVPVNPIFDSATMLHEGVLKSTEMERLPGYAKILLAHTDVRQGENIIVASNSGINPVPIEMAMEAKGKGLKVIAVTSIDVSGRSSSRHSSRRKLMDTADIIIDNCLTGSDASIKIESTGQLVAPVSTIAGAYIVNRIVIDIVNMYVAEGKTPPVFKTANTEGGYEYNENLIKKYRERIKWF